MIRGACFALFALAAPAAAGAFVISPPIDCDLGRECFIQNYVDRDPGPGAADFTCGTLSYDGHKGTDFALPTLAAMRAGVDVLAAAPGTVQAIRDALPDIASSAPDAPDLNGQDCGNGVLISHGGGWETQYCHLKRGSVSVRTGQRVGKGTVLGQIGLSGRTEFPHVHLTLRHDGQVIDPFDPAPGPATCNGTHAASLWQHPVGHRAGGLIGVGIANSVPEFDAIEAGLDTPGSLPTDAPALVVWGQAFGGRAGDVVVLTLTGPQGAVLRHSETLPRDKARYFRAAGKRASGKWPEGTYEAQVRIIRDGAEISRRAAAFRITR